MPAYISRYDIFISYRRDGGAADARLMYDHLSKDGYSVSFDMDTLKNGNFNDELLRRVQQCRNFIILLSKGCFDRTLEVGIETADNVPLRMSQVFSRVFPSLIINITNPLISPRTYPISSLRFDAKHDKTAAAVRLERKMH